MKKDKEILYKDKFKYFLAVILFMVSSGHSVFATDVSIWPKEIEFDYDRSSYTDDAITIRSNSSTRVAVPEYQHDVRSNKVAYIKGSSNRKIKVSFDANCTNMHLLINLTVTSGTGIGTVCNYFVDNYTKLDDITLTLSGSLPSTVGKREFTWRWEVYAIPIGSSICAATTYSNTEHSYYVLYSNPKSPMSEPWTDILDYATDWASGESSSNGICTDILSNGFDDHYTWNWQCHELASDFVRMVSALGINAYLHRWASKNEAVGDMSYQRTRAFDPVGPTHGYGIVEWSWHQWAEAASYQRDPSANNSVSGNWGTYEDYLFTHYEKKVSSSSYEWVGNQSGQSSGCEADGNRYYWGYPTTTQLLTSWRGPDR